MKLKIASFLCIVLGAISYAQDDEWYLYDIDSIVSVGFPGEVYELDTIVKEGRKISLEAISDSGRFLVQKLLLDQKAFDLKLLTIPKDKHSLEQLYSNTIAIVLELDKIDFKSRETFEKNGLIGRKTYFEKKGDDVAIMETDLIYVNKSIYLFSYSNLNGVDTEEKREFFDNIRFNQDLELEQYYISPTTSKTNLMWKLIIGFFVLSFLFRFFTKKKKKSKRIRID